MKAVVFLAAISGFFTGLISFVVLSCLKAENAFLLAGQFGILMCLALIPLSGIYLHLLNKKYRAFEKELSSPVLYKTGGNFDLGLGKVKNGNIYFCEDGIVCVCLEEKPYTLDEILKRDICRVSYTHVDLNIFTEDGRMFVIKTPDAMEAVDFMMRKGWIQPR